MNRLPIHLVLPYLMLSVLPYLTLPYLTLPYLTLPYLTLPYLTLTYLTLPQVSRSSFLEGLFLFFLGVRENSKIREYSTYSTFALPHCVRAQRRDGASRAAERSPT